MFKFISRQSWFVVVEAWMLSWHFTVMLPLYKLQHSMFNGSYELVMTWNLLQNKCDVERFTAKFVTPIT
jgi:hypothetical protein